MNPSKSGASAGVRVLTLLLLLSLLSLVPVGGSPAADAAPLDVHVGETIVNGKPFITRRIEVPYETREDYQVTQAENGLWLCSQIVMRVLDLDRMRGLNIRGYADGVAPSVIGVYYPLNPFNYGTQTVYDLGLLSAQLDRDLGSGFGTALFYNSAQHDAADCEAQRRDPADLAVPVTGTASFPTAVDVSVKPVPGLPGTFAFSASASHPIVPEMPLEFRWTFEGGPTRGGAFVTGSDTVFSFSDDDPTSFFHRAWTLQVVSDNGEEHARVDGRVQALTVTLVTDEAMPVRVDEPFEVEVTLRAPDDNPDTLSGVQPIDARQLQLPAGFELVEGALETDFTLAPGEEVSQTYTIRATESGEGELATAWTSTDAAGRAVTGQASLAYEAVGTFDGDWFRRDGSSDELREGETVDIRVRVENETRELLTDVRLKSVAVTAPNDAPANPETGTPAVKDGIGGARLVPDPTTSLHGVLGATGAESVDFLDFKLTGVEAGEIELVASFTGRDPDGALVEGSVKDTWTVRDQPIRVEVRPDLRRPDGSAPELNTDNDGDGDVDLDDHRFDVEVEISNDAEVEITGPRFLDPAEPVDWSNNLRGEGQGAPKLRLLGLRGEDVDGPDGGKVPGPIIPLDLSIPDLAPAGSDGDSHTVTLVYEADGELDADGIAVVLGAIDGKNVRGSGTAQIKIVSGLLVEFTTYLTDPNRPTVSGQVVRISGYVENIDKDELDEAGNVIEEGRPVVVWITPLTEGNAAAGHLTPSVGGRTPLGAEYIELQPGERKQLYGILATTPNPKRSVARVAYRIDAWNLPENPGDAANPIAAERIDIIEDADAGRGVEHAQTLRFNDVQPQDLVTCETELYDAIVTCNFYDGLVSLVGNTVDAAKLAEQGIAEIGSATYWTGAWSMRQLADVAAALDSDPVAQARLAAELDLQLQVWNDFSILVGEGTVDSVGVLGGFIRETHKVLAEGDTATGLAFVSKFAGENPDLLLTAVLKARTLAAMGQSALRAETRAAAGTIVRESVDKAALEANQQLVSRIDDVQAKGLDPKKPKNGAVRPGLDVTDVPRVWRDLYGAARRDVDNLLQIAKEEGILIAFRSRSPRSIQLLKDGLAWLKPQSVKAKAVSAIDVAYLNFPQDALGKVVMMEPPIDFRLTGQSLDDALDAHMDVLKKRHPELLDDVWATEVRDRLKLRTKKYREHLSEWLEFGREGMPVGFGYSDNGVTTGKDVSELRNALVEITEVPNRYGPGTVKRYDLKVAESRTGTDFRHLTGDLDIVGFFNLDRSPIMDVAKRDAIYTKMRSLLGMQHGETLTWDHVKRAELLRNHIGPDAETLLVAAPNKRLYTSVLDEKKSSVVAPGGNFGSTFSLLNGPPAALKVVEPPVGALVAGGRLVSLADDDGSTNQQPQPFLLPADVIKKINNIKVVGTTVDGQQTKGSPDVIVRPDGTIVIYRLPKDFGSGDPPPPPAAGGLRSLTVLGAPLDAAADAHSVHAAAAPADEAPWMTEILATLDGYTHVVKRPDVGRLGGVWEPATLAEATALGDPGRFELPLTTWTDAPIDGGEDSISVLTTGELGLAGGDWFAAGDRVVVDPGGLQEQLLTVASVDGASLVFDGPLRGPQAAGVQLLFVAAATDPDPDPDPDPAPDPDSEPGQGPGPVAVDETEQPVIADGGPFAPAPSTEGVLGAPDEHDTGAVDKDLANTGSDAPFLLLVAMTIIGLGVLVLHRVSTPSRGAF